MTAGEEAGIPRRGHTLPIDYERPETAPAYVFGADGITILFKYRVVGVVYAHDREEAQMAVDACDYYLDAARIDSPNYSSNYTYRIIPPRRVENLSLGKDPEQAVVSPVDDPGLG